VQQTVLNRFSAASLLLPEAPAGGRKNSLFFFPPIKYSHTPIFQIMVSEDVSPLSPDYLAARWLSALSALQPWLSAFSRNFFFPAIRTIYFIYLIFFVPFNEINPQK
jgi:hypothetical protein